MNAKANFNKTCKLKKDGHKEKLLNDLCKTNECPSSFWKMIKSFQAKSSLSSIISDKEWYDYFRNLLNFDDELNNTPFDISVNEYLVNHENHCTDCMDDDPRLLNSEITKDEIIHVIKNLDIGKSPGIDGIVYEMYKYSIDIVI